jgi:hypothetical protein
MMKYILMMSGTKAEFDRYATWSPQELQANIAFMQAFTRELKDEGVFVANEGLAFPQQARLVRAGPDGEPVTDGIFPEAKEFLAGFWIIDVETPDDAYRIAARASAAPGSSQTNGAMPIEVRQIMGGHVDQGL